jgi:hypothetical protein
MSLLLFDQRHVRYVRHSLQLNSTKMEDRTVTSALKTVLSVDLLLFTDGQTSGFVQSCLYNLCTVKGKGTAVQLEARCGPEGSRRFRLPDFVTFGI